MVCCRISFYSVETFGPEDIKVAPIYYKYGSALLLLCETEAAASDLFGTKSTAHLAEQEKARLAKEEEEADGDVEANGASESKGDDEGGVDLKETKEAAVVVEEEEEAAEVKPPTEAELKEDEMMKSALAAALGGAELSDSTATSFAMQMMQGLSGDSGAVDAKDGAA